MTSRALVSIRVKAPVERAFDTFTREIGTWWKPNRLFQLGPRLGGKLVLEPGADGYLVELYEDGTSFEVGKIRVWDPPNRLVMSWRQAAFDAAQETELHVSFDSLGEETRVTVEHFGWDTIPANHAARHGFPLIPFQTRFAEWWQAMLRDYATLTQG